MHRNRLGVAVLTLIVVACGAGGASPTAVRPTTAPATASLAAPTVAAPTVATPTLAAPTATPAVATGSPVAGNVVVQLADSQYGQILVDAAGMTLYGEVLEGASGIPTCKDQCLERWPPLIVSGDFTVGEGLDQSIFTTVERQLGTQLQAGDYPLYRSADDKAPGDTNGQGAGQGFWFIVGADGELIKE